MMKPKTSSFFIYRKNEFQKNHHIPFRFFNPLLPDGNITIHTIRLPLLSHLLSIFH